MKRLWVPLLRVLSFGVVIVGFPNGRRFKSLVPVRIVCRLF